MTPEALAALPAGHRLIFAAGPPRSGSTAVYNIARLLLEQQGGSLTAGWFKDLAEPVGSTVLVKIHRWEPAMSKRADVVLICHRDLREVVRSYAGMGWIQEGSAVFDQLGQVVDLHKQWKPFAAADIAYEKMVADWNAAVAEIASALRIDASRADIDAIAAEVGEMAAPKTLADGRRYDPVTLLHRKHRNKGAQPLEIESEVHRRYLGWQTAHGYI